MEAMKMMRPYLNSYRYEERTYPLLSELLEQTSYHLDNMGNYYDIIATWFDSYFVDGEGEYDDIYMDEANRDIANELTNKYLIPRYYN